MIVAFSARADEEHAATDPRARATLDVQIDIVPRLFELVGPSVDIHTIEGLPLVGLPPARLSPLVARCSSAAIDVVGATSALVLTAPLFALIAICGSSSTRPGRSSSGRRGSAMNMREFTALKFRTMYVGHATTRSTGEYIRATMTLDASPSGNGLYKLERERRGDAVRALAPARRASTSCRS